MRLTLDFFYNPKPMPDHDAVDSSYNIDTCRAIPQKDVHTDRQTDRQTHGQYRDTFVPIHWRGQ